MIDIFSVKSWGSSSNKETESKSLQTTDLADLADLADQAKPKEKVFTPMSEILTYFEKEKSYTKDQALRVIGLVSNYGTKQVYNFYERFVFENKIKIQKNEN